MRYWTFDVIQLISDYLKNRKTLQAIQETRDLGRKYMKSPIGEQNRGDWEQYLEVLSLKEQEFQLYVDMVLTGLGDLPEIERLVLKYWLIDKLDDVAIIELCGIKNLSELNKIKKMAITEFTNIVMPN